MSLLKNIPEKLLMGPGPSCTHPDVYDALSKPTIGHLDPSFIEIMDQLKSMLRSLFNTKNDFTMPISGTGSAGMEACFVNLVQPGDRVLILKNGVFGGRMQDLATRLGATVETLDFEWGTPVLIEPIAEILKTKQFDLVAVVHAETSTGVLNPVQEIGQLLKGSDSLFLVDMVTSLGGLEVQVDDWGVDAAYSGTQKCLSCPPGLAPVTFSEKAMKVIAERKTKTPSWYLDISLLTQYWGGEKRVYHHTAPINMMYALYAALNSFFEEGAEKVFTRHEQVHLELVAGLAKLGFSMSVEEPYRLPMLNSVAIPSDLNESKIRAELLSEDMIEIGAGLGPLAGKIWRIGTMGHTAQSQNVSKLLEALSSKL